MSKRNVNQLLIGDTFYDLTEAYRNGARACRSETPFWANPHRDGSQRYADWAAGHNNEAAGLHLVNLSLDVIEAKPAGLEFIAPEEDLGKGHPSPSPSAPVVPAYKAFTTAHDEVVIAAELIASDPDRFSALPNIRDRVRPDSDIFWSEEERAASRQALDTLESALAEGTPSRPLLLLLDNSGSMRGRNIMALVGMMGEIGDALDRHGASFEVLGFTTRSWKGGRSREDWIMAGHPAQPGRLCDLRHIVYKGEGDAWVPENLSLMLTEGILKENVDGEALLWAAERGRALGGAVILHVTDGTPMDDSTFAANPADYLTRHLAEVTGEIGRDPDLTLIRVILSEAESPFSPTARVSETGFGRIAEALVGATLSALAAQAPDTHPAGPDGP
jgi:cobaltochelatase CobT